MSAAPRPSRRQRSDRGAVAVVFALLSVVLLGFAALGVDIAQQVSSKHLLIGQLDAASTAAASQLGNGGGTAGAVDAASSFFAKNGPGELDLRNVDFWCVAARKLNGDNTAFNPAMVADLQIPTSTRSGGVCNPDAAAAGTIWRQQDYQNRVRSWDGQRFSMSCSTKLCAVPCALTAQPANGWAAGVSVANNRPVTCNTIRVGAERGVPFSFAPVLGIDEGSTGSQISVACAGSCGAVAPNPMDVVVVADRTLSMTEPLACTLTGVRPCRDFRTDLVDGIKGMLQVMTPEQQYVALGALGPSEYARSTAEGKNCDSTGKGLVYPGASSSTATSGSWVPVSFKNDYLGSPDSNGRRVVNTTSRLVQAIDCLDNIDSTRENRLVNTRTALASPLKSAARYLLNKPGENNNIASLGGANRSGDIRKVIIFETDGEPWEAAATTTGSVTLDNTSEVFSAYTDFTTTSYTTPTPTVGSEQNGTPRSVTPGPASPYNQASYYPATYSTGTGAAARTYNYTYRYRTSTTMTTSTRTGTGGQQACQNFAQVAEQAKAAGILVITVGYNLSGAQCSGENDVRTPPGTGALPGPNTATGTPWISDLQPTGCRQGGSGTQAAPYTQKTSCAQNMTLTYTVPQSTTTTISAIGSGDALVTDVLAGASGGKDLPVAEANGCSTPALTADENADDDLFFCAARGDDLAPLFVTALSKVSTGVTLIRLP